MKTLLKIACILCLVLLSACKIPQQTEKAATPSPPEPTNTPTVKNLAFAKTVTASNSTSTDLPRYAVDGNPETIWNGGNFPPQWIQIDLGGYANIYGIRLTVSQYPKGTTIHQVYAGASSSDLKPIHEFSGYSSDNDVLEIAFTEPLEGIQFIKISTTKSLSWVGWREIEVLGYEAAGIPTAQPVAIAADIVYFNGTILTMEKSQPTAESIAIKGETILAVGSEADVMKFKGAATKLVDLGGLTMTPGFVDSHAHRIGDRWHFGEVSAEQAMEKALSQGWTSLHELFVFDQRLTELVNIDRAGAMPMRVSMYLTMNFEYDRDDWWKVYKPLQQYSPYLQIAGLKITLDREWGEQVFFSQEQFTQLVLDGTRDGWQIATHSFSPKANEIVLNGYEAALKDQNNEALRLRLEHIGTMTDEQLRKMAELGIIGSVQFINAGALVEDASFKKFIPANEVQHTARWRDLLNAGVFLIGNTDDPWCCTDWRNSFKGPSYDATVIQAIFQGVTLKNFRGRQPAPWQSAQVVTVQEALEMMTINSAYAAHQETVVGSIKPGKYADIVILSANPLSTPIDQIPDIYVVMTMVGGDAKYCVPGQLELCSTSP